jgi:hypothetical protein
MLDPTPTPTPTPIPAPTPTPILFAEGTHVVLLAQASMPSSCWGIYGRVAVLRARRATSTPPAAGRDTADWEVTYRSVPCFVGTSARCSFAQVLRETCDELPAALVVGNTRLARRCGLGEVLDRA